MVTEFDNAANEIFTAKSKRNFLDQPWKYLAMLPFKKIFKLIQKCF